MARRTSSRCAATSGMPGAARRSTWARRRLVGLAMAGALVVAACGNDDDTDDTDATPTTAAADEGAAETFEITAVDYAFDGVPASVPAGSVLTLTNSSDVELHELVLVQIPDDVDLSVAELVELPEDELDALIPPGPPTMVLIAPPGEGSFPVVGDGTVTDPGRYAMVCFIPTGADPEEFLAAAEEAEDGPPEVDGGPPHVVNGMFAELIVE